MHRTGTKGFQSIPQASMLMNSNAFKNVRVPHAQNPSDCIAESAPRAEPGKKSRAHVARPNKPNKISRMIDQGARPHYTYSVEKFDMLSE